MFAFSFSVVVAMLFGEVSSFSGAIAFVLGSSVVAGLIGMFTENVPLRPLDALPLTSAYHPK